MDSESRGEEITPENGQSEKPKKDENAFALPSDAQLLAYWHYQNSVKHPPVTWKISHTYKDGSAKSGDKQEKRGGGGGGGLIAELRGKGGSAFSKSRYAHDMRLLSKWRLIAGQKRDGCIQLDQQLDTEQKKYLQIKNEYRECLNALEQFLEQDHEASMNILMQAETEVVRTSELSLKRDELSRYYGQARLDVYHWEEAWRTVKACHRFLHKLAPYDGDDGEDLAEDDDDGLESESFLKTASAATSKAQTTASCETFFGNDSSLEFLITSFEKEISTLSKSSAKSPIDLGLLEPSDLIRNFRDIEQQNLNALIHLESLGGPMATMISRIDEAEVRVKTEIDDVIDGINQLETFIEREESRARRLERQSSRLVQRSFRSLICSEQALRVRVLVEDAYESCLGKNEAGLDALAMTRGLEQAYENLSSQLDRLPKQLVMACEKEGFRQEMKESREAEDAARKFELMNRLLSALRRILEPSEPRRRVLMKRSTPVFIKSKLKAKKKVSTTDAKPVSARHALHQDFFEELCKPNNQEDKSDVDA